MLKQQYNEELARLRASLNQPLIIEYRDTEETDEDEDYDEDEEDEEWDEDEDEEEYIEKPPAFVFTPSSVADAARQRAERLVALFEQDDNAKPGQCFEYVNTTTGRRVFVKEIKGKRKRYIDAETGEELIYLVPQDRLINGRGDLLKYRSTWAVSVDEFERLFGSENQLSSTSVLTTAPDARKANRTRQFSAPTGYTPGNQGQDRYQPEGGKWRLGRDIQTGAYVDAPQAARREGLYIIGITGTGKTGLMENLIVQDIKQGRGVGLLDPHGDLTHTVLSRLPPEREKDVIYLDITDYRYPFGVNLFACSDLTNPIEVQKTVDKVMHIFEKLYEVTRTTPLIIQYLRNCTHTLVANPGYTMADIPLLLRNKDCRSKLLANVRDRNVLGFWQDYEDMKPGDQRAEREPILRRLEELLQPLTFNIVGQSTSTIDIRQIIDESKILLVKLSAQLDSITSLIGSILIALFLNAAYSRTDLPVHKRRQFNLYADEFHRFATEDFATLLTEARKFGIATTIAHQARYQPGMTDGIRATSLSVKNLVVFKVNSQDGDELAGEFDITPQEAWEEEIEKEWEEELKPERREVLEPERIETIEVIDGEEPIQVYKREVIDHLLTQGHEDERVMQFVRTYLQQRIQAYTRLQALTKSHGAELDETQAIRDLNAWLYEGMKNTQRLFSELPQSVVKLFAFSYGVLVERGFFAAFYDFFYGREKYWHVWWVDEIQFTNPRKYVSVDFEGIKQATEEVRRQIARIDEKLRKEVLANPPQTVNDLRIVRNRLFAASPEYRRAYEDALQKHFGTYALDYALSKLSGVLRGSTSELAFLLQDGKTVKVDWRWFSHRGAYPEVFPPANKRPLRFLNRSTEAEFEKLFYEKEREKRSDFEEAFPHFLAFYDSLQLAQFALSQHPLMTTQSGLYQPRKRQQVIVHPEKIFTHPRIAITHPRKTIMHPQRTYADVRNEVASQLTNLDNFMARVRYINADQRRVECTIRTLDPKQDAQRPLFGQGLEDRIARIKEQNLQDGYVRERTEVEAEITQRQEQCSEQQQEPPISRHPQR